MLSFKELKEKYPMLTEEKYEALLSGEKDILLKSTDEYEEYYTYYKGELKSTKFVDKKKKNTHIVMEDDLV